MADLTPSDQERIAGLDAVEQAALVREGELTAEQLVSTAIARIERLNPTLNAVVTTAFDQALDSVKDGAPEGPLGGVPILMKDLIAEVAGMRLTEGSRFLRDHVSTVDSELVLRLRRAGLVILGKTNTCEFGMSPTVEPLLFGAAGNPWDTGRTTGGSSGGSAAAVASGMVPVAHASDMGGSIRIPASCCGLFGLKPTRARNPLGPLYGDVVGGLCVEHAVTRSVRDSAVLLGVTSGPDLGDPYRAPLQPGPFGDEVRRAPGRLRIAYTTVPAGGRSVHRDCRTAVVDAAALCEELGHDVVERDLVELTPEVDEAIGTVWGAAFCWPVRYWARVVGREPKDDELEPYTRAYYERSRSTTAAEYLLAVTTLQAFTRQVAAAFRDFDVWLSPTLAQPPPPLGAMSGTESEPFAGVEQVDDFVAFPLVVANITGCPAMSVPLFWSSTGLPIGVNFMARFGHEHTLFRLAGQLEQARPWGYRRPPVW